MPTDRPNIGVGPSFTIGKRKPLQMGSPGGMSMGTMPAKVGGGNMNSPVSGMGTPGGTMMGGPPGSDIFMSPKPTGVNDINDQLKRKMGGNTGISGTAFGNMPARVDNNMNMMRKFAPGPTGGGNFMGSGGFSGNNFMGPSPEFLQQLFAMLSGMGMQR